MSAPVVWHDIECGGYRLDLPLWRRLARAAGGPVLDVGAGTGRVTIDLAERGHDVVALDRDPALLAALAQRAGALSVTTVCADARDFRLAGRRFGLVIVPMQTIQLLGGPESRASFLRCARAHLAPGGLLAATLAEAPGFGDEPGTEPPLPDVRTIDGIVYASRPVAVRVEGDRMAIERIRETISQDGRRTVAEDVARLHRLSPRMLELEARSAGFAVLPRRRVPETDEYVGSTVVVLRA